MQERVHTCDGAQWSRVGEQMLTRQEAERLAQSVNALRPDWPVSSLLTTIHKRKDRPLLDLALELVYVALDLDSKSPARIDQPGPWKHIANPARPAITYREALPTDCGTCSRPFEFHSRLSAVDDHDYEARSEQTPTPMPPEVKKLVKTTAEKLHIERTTAKEPKPRHEPKPVDEVLAKHVAPEPESEAS